MLDRFRGSYVLYVQPKGAEPDDYRCYDVFENSAEAIARAWVGVEVLGIWNDAYITDDDGITRIGKYADEIADVFECWLSDTEGRAAFVMERSAI